MTELGAYTFLPWLRRGVANGLVEPAAGEVRGGISVELALSGPSRTAGQPDVTGTVARTVALHGPGDVIGIDPAQISRREPAHWTTNFEPNYFPAIEFFDEDFPWRYSPTAPVRGRLLPWLRLIVLRKDLEFTEDRSVASRPLSCVTLTPAADAALPPVAESWAWAHVHLNDALTASIVDEDAAAVSTAATALLDASPDRGTARLIAARHLEPLTDYEVMLVPTFETGRLAGLGHDPAPVVADASNGLTASSFAGVTYAGNPEPGVLPFYDRWSIRTSDSGDFESLVRLLKPLPADPRVGRRDIDASAPDPGIAGVASHGGALRLTGALVAPLVGAAETENEEYEHWDAPFPQPVEVDIATFVNLGDQYLADGTTDDDPLVTPPLYGRWPALTDRLLTERDGTDAPHPDNWVHHLNLDPRHRTAAGFGTSVVQANEDAYVEGAWDQLGDVLDANRRIRRAQLSIAAGMRLHRAQFAPLASASPAELLVRSAPLRARIVVDGLTVQRRLVDSGAGAGLVSAPFRAALRPRGRSVRLLSETISRAAPGSIADDARSVDAAALLDAANAGRIVSARPRTVPLGVATPDSLAAAVADGGTAGPGWRGLARWILAHRTLATIVSVVAALVLVIAAVVLFVLGIGIAALVVLLLLGAAVAAVLFRLRPELQRLAAAQGLKESGQTPAAVEALPGSASFVLQQAVDPRGVAAPAPVGGRETDDVEASRFKQALSAQFRMFGDSARIGTARQPVAIDLGRMAESLAYQLHPSRTVSRWVGASVQVPERIRSGMTDGFVEVMAYPRIDEPMYRPLKQLGDELFVPNLHLVPSDSVTLLQTDQAFIESYLVGVNHEFARELLWRQYPTDQRGSYFRQFWDVSAQLGAAPTEAQREALRDIPPIHRWRPDSELGDHDNRQHGGPAAEELVLVIRGELLKKYPNAIISAQQAAWVVGSDGRPDRTQDRIFDPASTPIPPLYSARVEPDLAFFGFPLDVDEARGDATVDGHPGWFFRIEEVPGDARFGFDVSGDGAIEVWNDLSWDAITTPAGAGLAVAAIADQPLPEPASTSVEHEQWLDDRHVHLGPAATSAEIAYVAFQAPVLVAIHASELLPPDGAHG